jgi:stage II sporulation protein R
LNLKFRILAVFAVFAVLTFLSEYFTVDESYIRLHIVANSDTYADQTLKENIRDELLASVGKKFTSKDSFDAVRDTIINNLGMIEEISEKVSKNANFNYDVVARFGEFEFPSVQYNDLVLTAGKYQALKVIIGEGAGSNWWCVMYPPLCITDSTRGTAVRNTGNINQASIRSDEQKPVEHRFRVAEWFRRSRSRLRGLFSSAERIKGR